MIGMGVGLRGESLGERGYSFLSDSRLWLEVWLVRSYVRILSHSRRLVQ